MKISEVAKLKPIERLEYWIKQRESIRLKRDIGVPKPWTDDEILQSYRFCNVRRMDDKVSVWLLDNWYYPNSNHKNMLAAVALARLINLPESLELITPYVFGKKWNAEKIKKTLRERAATGAAVYNGAYMIRGGGYPDKIGAVVDLYVQPFVGKQSMFVNTDSMELTWTALLPSFGMGSFMAGQVVADLRWAVEGYWEDRHKWAPRGPGSVRGMNRLHSRPIASPLSQVNFLQELQDLMWAVGRKLPNELTSRLEAHDWQNCLCEFDKYERTLFDNRRPKQKYPGV